MMFSVLISIYYKESPTFLKQSLDSVLKQTLLPDEVVLVEDGPLTKELDEVVERYVQRFPNIKVISLTENQGLGKALNEGLKHCSYDLVARMDTDDIAKPNRFEKQIAILERHPEIDVVGAWIDEFKDDTWNILSCRKLPEYHNEIFRFAKKRNPINHPVVIFKKNALLAAGGYAHFPFFEDYYLWVRMLINGARFYNIQESLLFFRFSADMIKRRGGRSYMLSEFKFQNKIREMGFISDSDFYRNICIRFVARVIPNSFRALLYKKFLRK